MPQQQMPPPDKNLQLGTLSRTPGVELRIGWAVAREQPFLSLRIWREDEEGRWWPSKQGFTITPEEFPEFLVAIRKASDRVRALVREGGERAISIAVAIKKARLNIEEEENQDGQRNTVVPGHTS